VGGSTRSFSRGHSKAWAWALAIATNTARGEARRIVLVPRLRHSEDQKRERNALG